MSRLARIIKNSLPFKQQLRALKRAVIPYQSNPGNDDLLLEQAMQMVGDMARAGARFDGATVVEIGSGWIPMLPLIFRMAGADKIVTVDQERLMDKSTFVYAVNYIRANLPRIMQRIADAFPFEGKLSRLPNPQTQKLENLLKDAGIQYRAPADFMALAPGSADFIVSRAVLEHIPEDILVKIFQHAAQVLKPGGMMCHLIDMSDHFEHRDKSLSRVDMLRYTDKEWRARIHDPQDYQNRLRRFDFLRILEDTGWEIVLADGEPHRKALEDLRTMSIIPRYANIPHEELAILTSMVIAKRKTY